MNWVEVFRNQNSGLEEKYNKLMNEIKAIEEDGKLSNKLKKYFVKSSEFIFLLRKITDSVSEQKMDSISLEEYKELNSKLYEDILGENYEKSYANPQYSVRIFGEELGKLLSFVYTNLRDVIESAFSYKLFNVVNSIELFYDTYKILCDNNNAVDLIKSAIEKSIYKNMKTVREVKTRLWIDSTVDYKGSLIKKSKENDFRYLYQYDGYVSDNEIKIAEFLNSLSEEKIESMADVSVEGLLNAHINNNLDISKKKYIIVYYTIGFERLAGKIGEGLEAKGLTALFDLYQPYYTNRQYKYDHKDDEAIYFSEKYTEEFLENYNNINENYREELKKYGGAVIIFTFGEKQFAPINKNESIKLSDEQTKINIEFNTKFSIADNKYMHRNETMNTLIAYPVPEIGEDFDEIFKETIKINTLDSKLYSDIQKCMIDVLDKGDYVHVLGMNDNKTDLIINLQDLKNPEKETLFYNGLADRNIPVGEVFTSPVLKGTNGKLHVSEVFLEGFSFKDLEIDLKDGMIDSYTCKNFENEEENKKLIKENILYNHETIPIGEFAIGTNTAAYVMGRKFGIQDKLPILISEKTGPHFAMGDTCYYMSEDEKFLNPDGKEMIAKDNECSIIRKSDMNKAYFNCHTDISLPYNELYEIAVYTKQKEKIVIISEGRFVLPGTEKLNEAFL